MTTLSDEYNTLRSEMLQIFREQTQLAFATAIASAGILFALLNTSVPVGAGVAVWMLILIGISWKLTGNYNRLFRIGTYIKVIHEMNGDPSAVPGMADPAWIYRSRSIGQSKRGIWQCGSGSRIDAAFLQALGVGGFLFVALDLLDTTKWDGEYVASAIVAMLAFMALIATTRTLAGTSGISKVKAFEEELRKQLRDGV